jgi:Cu/Ag efflux pump CusA
VWIVDIALRRPYTFIVMALLLPLFGVLSLLRMPVDIFPRIPIPILSAVWTYNGLSAEEMSARITTLYERGLSTTLNDVEHMESQSLPGTGMVKVFLYPGASVEKAQSQMVSSGQSTSRSMPPGISPPVLISYDASNVPVLQLAVTSKRLAEHDREESAPRLIVQRQEMQQWLAGYAQDVSNEVKQLRDFDALIKKIAEMGFITPLPNHPDEFEVQRILKAFISAEQIISFQQLLMSKYQLSGKDSQDE